MQRVISGMSQKEISAELGISQKTTNTHLEMAKRKYGFRTLEQMAVAYATQR